MSTRAKNSIFLAASIVFCASTGTSAQADYGRAERFLTWNTTPLIVGDAVSPNWLSDGQRFWYRLTTHSGADFVLIDPTRNAQRLVFDNARLAAAMSVANDTSYQPTKLPFRNFEFVDGEGNIKAKVGDKEFRCDVRTYQCSVRDTVPELPISFTTSPDGNWEAFVHDFNLWIRPAGGGDSTQLTSDGEEYWGYGSRPRRAGQIVRGDSSRPILQWSPDSRLIAVQRTDERNVELMPLYSSTSQRPKFYTVPYALPGDTVIPVHDIFVLDIESGDRIKVDAPPQTAEANGFSRMSDSTWITVKWGEDSNTLYFTHVDRGPRWVRLMAADVATGETRVLAEDSSRTYVELNLEGGVPNWRIANGGSDVLWFSERDGWGHLYRYDSSGNLANQITSGPWTVGEIKYVDDAAGRIYFTGRGREPGWDPYYAALYAVNFDGSGLQLLSPERANHIVTATPGGGFFIDSYSRLDQPPKTVLRRTDGGIIRTLAEADISRLLETGWRFPEPFTVKARDGITDLHGVMYKPTSFDSTKQYPVIDHIYPGPQIIASPKSFFPTNAPGLVYATFGQIQALAELGFIVVHIDAMGTNLRSKAFHDTWYGNMGDNGLPDHIAALRQLGTRHSFIDLDRVGIYGHSGGGFASTDAMLRHPDFFKVAVSTAGNHDNRTYYYGWAERYQGLLVRDTVKETDNYDNQANFQQAENLKGKLFIMHGDMDDNVHPAMTIRLADALIKANKDFDFLILPDMTHGVTQNPYVIRRTWDYFVEHLLGEEPPLDYRIEPPPERGN